MQTDTTLDSTTPAAAEAAPAAVEKAAPAPVIAEKETPGDKLAREEKALDDDLRKVFRKSQREEAAERDETGKFRPKDGTKPEAKLPDSQKEAVKTEAKTTEAKPVEAKPAEAKPAQPVIPPPAAWKAEDKAKFGALPPDVQKTIAERETQAHKEISDLGQFKKAFEDIKSVMEPHKARMGEIAPKEYVAQLFQADADLTRDPVAFMRRIAEHYKIDMNSLVGDPYAVADPQSAQLQHSLSAANARIEHLEKMIGEVGQRVSGREQTEQQARASESERLISDFAADKPDFYGLQVEIDIAVDAIKKANPALSPKEALQEAYDRARWANPTTRKAILEQQQREAESKRLEEARTASERARRAGGINIRGSQQPVNGALSLDDDLRGVWRRHHA